MGFWLAVAFGLGCYALAGFLALGLALSCGLLVVATLRSFEAL